MKGLQISRCGRRETLWEAVAGDWAEDGGDVDLGIDCGGGEEWMD